MVTTATIPETLEYRMAIVQADSHAVLVLDGDAGYLLPRVRIPRRCRGARQLQKELLTLWGVHALILDFVAQDDSTSPFAVAEVLTTGAATGLKAIDVDQVSDTELAHGERGAIVSLLNGEAKGPFARIGWIDEASEWIEAATGRKVSSKRNVEQYNAGRASALVKFHSEGGDYWLKATGAPNTHELSVTCLLSGLCGIYLPKVIDARSEWNAWLTSGEADGLITMPADPFDQFCLLADAVESMAELQIRTVGHELDLLAAGAFDQRACVFEVHSGTLFEYLEEAMSRQTSTRVAPIERKRLRELREILNDVCGRMSVLGLPDAIVHGDMSLGNILSGRGHCKFIDWCEAYVGNPLITLQHLLLLKRVENPELRTLIDRTLKDRYRAVMLKVCDSTAFDEGLVYMPLFATASALYGRGDWLNTSRYHDPRQLEYARSVTRYMDRAARDPMLLKALGVGEIRRLCISAPALPLNPG